MVMLDCGILGLYVSIYGDDVMMIETLFNSKLDFNAIMISAITAQITKTEPDNYDRWIN